MFAMLCVFATSLMVTSCKKDDEKVDPRLQFVGTWIGTFTTVMMGDTEASKDTAKISLSTTDATRIVFDGQPPMTAVVTGNNFVLDKVVNNSTEGGIPVTSTIMASGSLSAGVLTMTGTISVLMAGQTLPGTLAGSWKKQ